MPGRYTGILKFAESRSTLEEVVKSESEKEAYKDILAANKANMLQEAGFCFEDKVHGNEVLLRMNTIRKEGNFCDGILNIQNHSLHIHKIVLASSSVFFFELFSKSEGGNEQRQYDLDTSNMDFNSLRLIINYFYTSKLQCVYHSIRDLYRTANHLKLSSLTQNCFQYMLSCLTIHNCLGTYTVASAFEKKEKVDVMGNFIQEHIDSILESSLEFSQLSCIVVDIVGTASSDFNVTEQPLCKLVVHWLYTQSFHTPFDSMLDKKYMLLLTPDNKLVDCLDLQADQPLLQSDLIQDYKKLCFRKQNHVKDTGHSYKQMSRNKLSSSSLSSKCDEKLACVSNNTPSSSHFLVASTVVAENSFMSIVHMDKRLVSLSIKFKSDQGLSSRLSSSSNISLASSSNGCFANTFTDSVYPEEFCMEIRKSQCLMTELAGMKVARCGFGVGLIEEEIFIVGGYGRTECLNSVESYSLEKNTWRTHKGMQTVRGRFCAGVLQGQLVVCGGSDGASELSSVEMFNPQTNSWSSLPDMLFPRSNAGVAVCEEKLYVIGGLTGSKTLSHCEVYEPEIKKWSHIADLNTGRSQAAVCVFKVPTSTSSPSPSSSSPSPPSSFPSPPSSFPSDSSNPSSGVAQIAVLGGSNSWNCMNCCDSYTPKSNSWYDLPPLSIARRGAGAAFFNGMLYVVGGSDGQTTLNSVEMYDPVTGTWSFASNLGMPRANMGAVVKGRMFFVMGGFGGKSFLRSQEYLSDETDEWCSYLPAETSIEALGGNQLKKSSSTNCLPSYRGKGICLNLDPLVTKLTNGDARDNGNVTEENNVHNNIQSFCVSSNSSKL